MRTWTARFRGVCSRCGGRVEPDTECVWLEAPGHYAHAECPDGWDAPGTVSDRDDAVALTQPRCTRCGLNHPGEC